MNKNIIIGLFSILFIVIIYLFVGFRQLSSQDDNQTIVTNNVNEIAAELPYHTHGPVDNGVTEERVIELINSNTATFDGENTIRNAGPSELGYEISSIGDYLDFNKTLRFHEPTSFERYAVFNEHIQGRGGELEVVGDLKVNNDLEVGNDLNVLRDLEVGNDLNVLGKFKPFVGMIVPLNVDFSNTTIIADLKEKGWVLCDGSHGTPDLQGRFVWGGSINDLGAGFSPNNDASETFYKTYYGHGGAASTTLGIENMPKHKHGGLYRDRGGCGNSYYAPTYHDHTGDECNGETLEVGGNDSLAVGQSVPHDNLPPYRVLAYFMYLPNWQSENFTSQMMTRY